MVVKLSRETTGYVHGEGTAPGTLPESATLLCSNMLIDAYGCIRIILGTGLWDAIPHALATFHGRLLAELSEKVLLVES